MAETLTSSASRFFLSFVKKTKFCQKYFFAKIFFRNFVGGLQARVVVDQWQQLTPSASSKICQELQ